MKIIKPLQDEKTLNELLGMEKVLIFKNSMNCGISRNARRELETYAVDCDCPVEIYMVDVINERELSKKIESLTGIHHESPQAICLEKGKVTWHDSHYNITTRALKNALENQD